MSLLVTIQKRLGRFSLDVSFETCGETLGVLGASGAGKSLTLKCIAGLETPDSGRIVLHDRVLFDSQKKINLMPQQRKVGYLFQDYALFPHKTVAENLRMVLPKEKDLKNQRIGELLDLFRLSNRGGDYPHQLSGGERQRVALARILAFQPEILLLDEPFSALDVPLKEELQMELLSYISHYQKDTIVVTHNQQEAFQLSQTLLVLDGGRSYPKGSTKESFTNPRYLAVARLTGCKNFSAAEILSDTRIKAIDWGVELRVTPPIPPKTTIVGVYEQDFFLPIAAEDNRISVTEKTQMDGPFSTSYLLETELKSTLWWSCPKNIKITEKVTALGVQPEHILFLEE